MFFVNNNSIRGDDTLLDIFIFLQAFTMAQNYEAQLIKIIHAIGALNGGTQ
jgi:hypothetical protein